MKPRTLPTTLHFFTVCMVLVLCLLFIFQCSTHQDDSHAKQGTTALTTAESQPNTTVAAFDIHDPDFFSILAWDAQHGFHPPFVDRQKFGLDTIKACNYTLAGFVRPEDLPICEELGLGVFLSHKEGFIKAKNWAEMSDEEITEKMKALIDETNNSPAVVGYFITDEPGASAFHALRVAVDTVKNYAPGKLAYINLFPNYATIGAEGLSQLETESYMEYLERYVEEVNPQFISYDNYMIQYGMDGKNEKPIELYYRNLLDVRTVAQKHNIPFWNIVSCNQIRTYTTIPSPSNLALQAYTTLAAGGAGVTWYTYYSCDYYFYAPINRNNQKTMSWYYLQEINRQLKVIGPKMASMESTGVYFTSPSVAPDLPPMPGNAITTIEAAQPIMVGEFKDKENHTYAMLVNLSLESSVNVKIETAPPYKTVYLIPPVDGHEEELNHELGFWLVAGQGMLLRLVE